MAKNCKINLAALFILLSVLTGCGYSDIADTINEFTNIKDVCTVTFDSNGGSYIATQTVNSGGAVTRPTDPTKSGYTFDGWYGDSELKTMYIFSAPVTGNITLYAKWYIVPTYTVRFDSNGGSYIEEKSVNSGGTVNRPTDPFKSGYTLVYWCSDSGLATRYDFSTPVTGDITLYAEWKSVSPTEYIVTFESNGGSYIDTQIVNLGGTVNRPIDPTKSGYTFDGWYSNLGSPMAYDFSTPVTGNITLYAKWNIVQTYTVTFESNGGSYIATQTVNSGGAASRPTDPTRSGYTFDDWYSNSGLTTKYNFSMQVTGNITLYAKWNSVQTYTVTFDKNGGDTEASPPTKTVISPAATVSTLPTEPTRTGYTFVGWYTVAAATGGTQFTTTTTVNKDTIVYARWTTDNTYTVTFDKNGGDTEASPPTKTVISPAINVGTLPTEPTRTGYTFVGWYTVAAVTGGTQFIATTTVDKDIRVYARWTAYTPGSGNLSLNITFEQIKEGSPLLSESVIIHRSSANGPTSYTFTLNNPAQYSSIAWYVYDVTRNGESFTLNSSNIFYNMIGIHVLTLEVVKDGLLYTRVITFEVKQ